MRNSIIKLVLVFSVSSAVAQQLPFSSQYYTNMFTINPAFTGTNENTRGFLTHRSQWTGLAGAPQTSYLTVDGPIQSKNIGLGLNMYSDVTSMISRVGVAGNYSYGLKINDDNHIRFGLALGIIDNKIDFTKAVVRDTDDPFLFTTAQHKTVFNADFGVAYNWRALELGVAVPQLLGNKIRYKREDGSNSYYNMGRSYQGTIRYTFDVVKEKGITAYPLVMVRYAEGSVIQYDINAVLDWSKIGWFGVTYHSNYAVALSAGVRYKNLSVGYAYDLGIGPVKSYTGSSSEFLLSYNFGGRSSSASDEVVRKEEPKDTLTDAMLAKLKAKTDSNEVEISRLKAALANAKGGAGTLPTEHTENLTENLMRTAPSNDFVDENGMSMGNGFYVVIGTFSSKDNANKFKDANIIKGYNGVAIIQNHKTKVYYVYVKETEKQEDAEAEQQKYKVEYPDVWIQKLE